MSLITISGDNLKEISFELEEEVQLRYSSNYGPIVEGSSNKFIGVASSVITGLSGGKFSGSGQYKQFGFQLWQGTEPVSISFTITGYTKDQMKAIELLTKRSLPSEASGAESIGGLIPPGPTLLSLFDKEEEEKEPEEGKTAPAKSADNTNSSGKGVLSVAFGSVRLSRMTLRSVEPTFSKFVDARNRPIWIKASIEMMGMITATSKDVNWGIK